MNIRVQCPANEAVRIHSEDMPEVAQPSAPDQENEVDRRVDCRLAIAGLRDSMETSAIEAVDHMFDLIRHVPCFASMRERCTHGGLVQSQLHCEWQAVISPHMPQRAEDRLSYRHAVFHIALSSPSH